MPLSPPQLTVRYVAIIERRYLTFGCISPQGGVNTHWAVMHRAERANVGSRFILRSISVVHDATHGQHQLSGETGMPKGFDSCARTAYPFNAAAFANSLSPPLSTHRVRAVRRRAVVGISENPLDVNTLQEKNSGACSHF
jgi:hypothetical protein